MTLRRAVPIGVGALALLVLGHVGSFGAHFGRDLSNVAWVVAPAVGCGWMLSASRRYRPGSLFRPSMLLAGTLACWTIANAIWAVFDLILDRPVPSPSPADPFYVAALALGIAGCLRRLGTLVSRATVVRAALDGVLLGTSMVWIVWWVLHGRDAPGALWGYPVLGVTAGSLALMVMTRNGVRNRPSWGLIAGGFLLVAAGDTMWAYNASRGGFMSGRVGDVLWPAGYLCLGFAALAMPKDVAVPSPRELTSRWELLVPYPTVLVAFAIGAPRHAELSGWEAMPLLALAGVVLMRQVLSLWENQNLLRTLEVRVSERTVELRAREAHFRAIVQGITDVVLVLGSDGITEVSPSVTDALGYRPDALIGQSLAGFLHPDDLKVVRPGKDTKVFHTPGASGSASLRLLRADGTWCPMEARFSNLAEVSDVGGVLVTMRDVTERVALEDRLRQQANHDDLTGLANRRQLHAALDMALAGGRFPALVLLDLDDFKAVNDSAGHQLGDELLIAVADRLRRCTRPSDLVARLGGDEFAVLVGDDPDVRVATSIAQRIIDDLDMPLRVFGQDVRCAGTAGVAGIRAGGHSAADLLRDADVAMYVAKRQGKGRFAVFSDEMHSDVLWRQTVETELRAAIQDRRLLIHYQPIVDLTTGAVTGAEALVRLVRPSGVVLLPEQFVSIAEETGLIGGLGAAVLRRACEDAAGWQALRPDGPPLSVSVNVSSRQLEVGGLRRLVADALEQSGLPPHLLTIELTEGALAAGHTVAEQELAAVRALGVRLAVDDFGAGYSSLGRLRALAVDELKIDRSLVEELAEGGDAPLVEVVLAMASRLHLDVVAEGIELPSQGRALRSRGCRSGQGYLFAEPAASSAMAQWVNANFLTMFDSTSVVESP